jgi:hypothetical protein
VQLACKFDGFDDDEMAYSRDVNKTSPFSYATVTTYSDIEGGSAAFLGEYEDYQVSLEFGVSKPYHQVRCLPIGHV